MIDLTKLKMPKLNLELIKKNTFVFFVALAVIFLILDIVVWLGSKNTAKKLEEIRAKKEEMRLAKEKISKFASGKAYLKIEDFKLKVPVDADPPMAAMQQAGIIISATGAGNLVTISEADKGGAVGAQGPQQSSPTDELIPVGTKSLKEMEFTLKFNSTYSNFMRILEKLAAAEPLLVVKKFSVNRNDGAGAAGAATPVAGTPFVTMPEPTGDIRNLEIELTLSTFSEMTPDKAIWSIGE